MKKILILIITIILSGIIISGSLVYFLYKPDIKLNGDKNITLNVDQEYKEEGAVALIFNKKDSNVKIKSDVVINKVGSYKVVYEYQIPYLNKKTIAIRYVTVVDNELPVITLKGKESVSLYVGGKYTEEGYSAADKYDGDLTDKVIVTNNVDFNKAGNYEIVYEVSDSSNNKASVKRSIEIKEKPVTKVTSTNSVNVSSNTGEGLPILMYHFFYDESKGEKGKDNNYMEIHAFEEQMKYLAENDYYFPTWQEVADYIDKKITLPKKSVVVTVDDGHISYFNEAVPVIDKYNIKVTSFLITRWNEERYFAQIQGDKFVFESHTHNMHQGGCSGGAGGLFRCIKYEDGLNDLKRSIEILGSSDAIAYPFGDVTDNTLKITKDAGFKVGVTTKQGKAKPGMDRYQLPRVRMSKGISLKRFIESL